jgi:hypothetical protein
MFARLQPSDQNVTHLERVEALVRGRYGLTGDQLVLVREERETAPGVPRRVTTVLFWTAPGARHRIRVFKPADEVTEADLPAPWLRSAIRDDGTGDCC